ncbi:hypothetical protein [Luteolibacter soli]|uniref:Antitoxin n=1 Tax=Luteolibacter soli TaxID=3135280 RepID=A0ABU9B0V6_9BACT
MKTSIDLPDSLHHKAQARAAEQGVSLGEIVVAALEKGLDPARAATRHPGEPHFEIDELGLPRLRRMPGDTTVITEELLNLLREREGV